MSDIGTRLGSDGEALSVSRKGLSSGYLLGYVGRRPRRTFRNTDSKGFCSCTRIANDLGLHLDPMPLIASRCLTQEEAYVRCITFWGIWTLDKEFGALLGRPCVFRDMVITCPRPAYWRSEDFVGGSTCMYLLRH